MIAKIMCGAGALVLSASVLQGAAVTAVEVISYNAGAPLNVPSGVEYDDPQTARGLPSERHNVPFSFEFDGQQFEGIDDSILSPINAAYGRNQMVGIGAGGSLTLRLSSPVPTNGTNLGVHSGSGQSWDFSGSTTIPANYTDLRAAEVLVSNDNLTWHTLGLQTFDAPSNYYSDSVGPFTSTAGTQVANFDQPFLLSPTDFNGKTYAEMLALYANSGGGEWLDLSSVSGDVDAIEFIRFVVPIDATEVMYVDSVTAIPEPACTTIGLASTLLLLRRRRRA
jgi:hypothetical protein